MCQAKVRRNCMVVSGHGCALWPSPTSGTNEASDVENRSLQWALNWAKRSRMFESSSNWLPARISWDRVIGLLVLVALAPVMRVVPPLAVATTAMAVLLGIAIVDV